LKTSLRSSPAPALAKPSKTRLMLRRIGVNCLNDVLKVKNEFAKYGKWYETISAVTGLIKQYEKDTWLRKFLKILGKNHCEEAITEMQKYYYDYLFMKNNQLEGESKMSKQKQ
jgi:hypothetical protein